MKSKSTTQKLKIRWQDRSWLPRIESQGDRMTEPGDRVAIYNTADESLKSDTQLIIRHRRVTPRTGLSAKQPWNN